MLGLSEKEAAKEATIAGGKQEREEYRLQKTSKMDTVVFSIYKTYHKNKKTMGIIMMIVNVLLFLYYLPFFNPTMGLLPHGEIWDAMYVVVNPFTIGAYILGVVVLIQYMMYDGWIIKALIGSFYGWIILISLVVIMGMTSVWELCIYIPHLMVIVLCGIVTRSKQKIRLRDAATAQCESVKEQ